MFLVGANNVYIHFIYTYIMEQIHSIATTSREKNYTEYPVWSESPNEMTSLLTCIMANIII